MDINTIFQMCLLVIFGLHAVAGHAIEKGWKSYPLATLPRWIAGFIALGPLAIFVFLGLKYIIHAWNL